MGAKEWEKVVAFCKWVSACWYESAPIQDCKMFFFIIKDKDRDENNDGFSHIGFPPKNLSVHVCWCVAYVWWFIIFLLHVVTI